jgi:hypothetical protein
MCTFCDSTNINKIIEFVRNWQVVKTPTSFRINLYIHKQSKRVCFFCVDLSRSWLYMVSHVRNAMFRSVSLDRLATLCMSGLRHVNVIHFFLCVCVGVFLAFSVWVFCSLNSRWSVMENRCNREQYTKLLINCAFVGSLYQ